MYHLTFDQYDTLYTAAHNFQATIQTAEMSWPYQLQLEKYTIMLTGVQPTEATINQAAAYTKSILYGDHREDINKIIEIFIGPYTYDEPPLPTEEELTAIAAQAIERQRRLINN